MNHFSLLLVLSVTVVLVHWRYEKQAIRRL